MDAASLNFFVLCLEGWRVAKLSVVNQCDFTQCDWINNATHPCWWGFIWVGTLCNM